MLVLMTGACASSNNDDRGTVEGASPSFNEEQANISFQAGSADIKSGNIAAAIRSFEQALVQWPAHRQSWEELFKAYESKGDQTSMNYVAYFGKRVVWANSLRPRIAAGAFENVGLINEETPFQDTRIPETAERLVAFYRQKQTFSYSRNIAQLEKQETIWDSYLIYPVAIISAGVAYYALRSKLFPGAQK